jgi:hypothetical protein
MGFFNIFKSKSQRELENLEYLLKATTEIFEIIKNKKKYSDMGIKDYNFDKNMSDKLCVYNHIKYNLPDSFNEEYNEIFIRIFNSDELDENYQKDVNNSFHFLSGYTSELKRIIEKKRNTL